MSDIFNFDTYQGIIRHRIDSDSTVKGAKSRLAKIAGIQPAYLSQVLAGETHLSLDQAASMAESWDFTDIEMEYFLTLVNLARAGTLYLKKKLNQKINNLKSSVIKNPFAVDSHSKDTELAATYYSDPIFSQIHMLLRIKQFQSINQLATHIQLPLEAVRRVLNQMDKLGLVTHSLDKWLPIERNVHAEPDSIFAKMHHKNWHIKALNRLSQPESDDLFYTALHSLSENDFIKIKEIILQNIRKTRKIVEPSLDETAVAFNISWFRI